MSVLKGKTVLLGVTGSVAAYKACEIVRRLRKSGAHVQVLMTRAATEMVGPTTFTALTGREVLTDLFPHPPPPGEIHIDAAQRADVALVAPATANTMAKVAQGVADDLLSTVLLVSNTLILMAPAMHVQMWRNKATQDNMATLKDRDVKIIEPQYGPLADLSAGEGRMAEPGTIVSAVREILGTLQDLAGKHVLVTAGPTREPIDPVRFISNRSSGRMGYSLAQAAFDRGATVTLITGPTHLDPPDGCHVVNVETAEEMSLAVRKVAPSQDLILMAAAVADFAPTSRETSKIDKDKVPLPLPLRPTPDIAKVLRDMTAAWLVGFALETDDGERRALQKLEAKRLDAIVLNYANRPGSGFDEETNEGVFFVKDAHGKVSLPLESKQAMAHRILSAVVQEWSRPRKRAARPQSLGSG
ncbi:MAG: bifunctional phosphopantothenoylcysteine decarboxylase/phosphopantothenate--cysteine ligase CoaBC [Fidelibacterota bacterium]